MPLYNIITESAQTPTPMPATHVCRVCGCTMDALHRAESIQTNRATGETRVIPASTVITCKNADCKLYYQTFEAKTYHGEDLRVYGVEMAVCS